MADQNKGTGPRQYKTKHMLAVTHTAFDAHLKGGGKSHEFLGERLKHVSAGEILELTAEQAKTFPAGALEVIDF